MRQIKLYFAIFVWWLALSVVMKLVFIVMNRGVMVGIGAGDVMAIIWHGRALDISVSGYLTVIPGLLLTASPWLRCRWLATALAAYVAAMTGVVIVLGMLDSVLYGYWGFPLDTTPFFYFLSSPKDAFASAGAGDWAAGGVALTLAVAVSVMAFRLTRRYAGRLSVERSGRNSVVISGRLLDENGGRLSAETEWRKRVETSGRRWAKTVALLVLTAALIVPIRGGVTVSTMNTGEAYFSQRAEVNHAAVNPLFSLMESALKQQNLGSQYRYMADEEAERLFRPMTHTQSGSTRLILTDRRPDVYLIVMESFSRIVMREGATPELARMEKEGVSFPNFFANSFRTDRGLVSILSGCPAPPTMSLMKNSRLVSRLPSLARTMVKAGYRTEYYYGGDIDFCNQRGYLVSQGFQRLISDKDFDLKYRMSKWGVPDSPLMERARREISADQGRGPVLRVVQTSSSHEPFDVPVSLRKDRRLNAFAYADMEIGGFVRWLKQSGRWDRSLVILVADHLGAYPPHISNLTLRRYRIPLVMTGGAVKGPAVVEAYGSQQDIAATVLGQLGLSHAEFTFSKNLLDAGSPHFAFFTCPDAFGVADSAGHVIYDNARGGVAEAAGTGKRQRIMRGKAYLQRFYDSLAGRE